MKRNKRNSRKTLRKDRVFVLVLFLIWTIICGWFLLKIAEPVHKQFILKDNYIFNLDYNHNIEETNESFEIYKNYNNSLINGDDKVISTFFKLDGLVKAIIILFCFIPFGIIALFFTYVHEENQKARRKRLSSKRKLVRA